MWTTACVLLIHISLIFMLGVASVQRNNVLLPVISDFDVARKNMQEPTLYFITPTHKEYTQLVDLTRMSQFLQLSSIVEKHNIYWIVIEDRDDDHCSPQIRSVLERSGVAFAHVYQESIKISPSARYGHKFNKGISQRNHAMDILERHFLANPGSSRDGVLYFADGDNAYDLRLASELVQTRGLSVFPVGFTAKLLYERCVVDKASGRVTSFVGWRGGRKYPIDMAGFAMSLQLFMDKRPRFRQTQKIGRLESNFISQVISHADELQPLAANCSKVFVWHTKTDARIPAGADPQPGDAQEVYDTMKLEV